MTIAVDHRQNCLGPIRDGPRPCESNFTDRESQDGQLAREEIESQVGVGNSPSQPAAKLM